MVIATHMGRTAVWQLARIWGIGAGDEVLLPAYNCGTEVDPWIKAGAKPVLYRVDSRGNIDARDLMARATAATRVVYVTHYFGWPQAINELADWCRRRNYRLVEDCALALFSRGPAGALGMTADAAIFSPKKFLAIPDGGFLTLKEAAAAPLLRYPPMKLIARRMLSLAKGCALGVPAAGWVLRRIGKDQGPRRTGAALEPPDMPASYYLEDSVRSLGTSRTGLWMMRRANPRRVVERRRHNYLQLDGLLRNNPRIKPLYDGLAEGICPMALPVLVPQRRRFVDRLNRRGIAALAFWEGYHRGLNWDDFPEARELKDHVAAIPVEQTLGPKYIVQIAQAVNDVVKEL
jgi:dTDP-4-amino-4,6-dideoxygalactose transaminase